MKRTEDRVPSVRLIFLCGLFIPGLLGAQPSTPFGFERIDSRDGLSHNSVFAILQDRQGFLWLGTQDGLNRYDGYGFTVFRHHPDDPASLSANAVFALAEDPEGTLWVATRNALNRFDPLTHAFTAYRPAEGDLTIFEMTFDAEGHLWTKAVPDATVHQFDPATETFTPRPTEAYPQPASARIREIKEAPEAAGWPVLEDAAGHVWVGTSEGLYVYEGAERRHVPYALAERTSSIARDVRALYQDQAGTLWVGTLSGLYRRDPNLKPFHHIRPADDLEDPQAQSPVMAIAQDRRGHFWLGTLGGGIMHMDLARRTARTYTVPHPVNPAAANNVWAVYVDPDDTVWLGTSAGLAAFDPATSGFTWHNPPGELQYDTDLVLPGFTERDLLIGSVGGISQVDRTTRQRRLMAGADVLGLAAGTWMEYLVLDPARRCIWMLSEQTGFVRYEVSTGQVMVPSQALNHSLKQHTGWVIHTDSGGSFWISTENGLRQFNPDTGAFTSYFAPPEMPGTIIYSLLAHPASGHLWMGTNHGLARFDPASGRYKHFDVPGQVEFNRRAALRLADGRMLFGGLEGITMFHPDEIKDNAHIPPVVITQIQHANQASTTTIRSHADTLLVLAHDDNSVAITYAALNFTQAHKNQYRYRLAGLETGWHEAGTRRRVDYANLPPGRYTFEVQGSNNDGLWSTATATLALVVLPPFWQTGWFRLLLLALLGGLLYTAYRYRVRRLLEVERMRLRIAGDLHDDIGSKLSGMALMSELLETDPSLSEAARADLQELGTSTREIIRDLRDIVWFIDPEHDRAGKTVEKMQQATRSLLNGMPYTFDTVNAALLEQAPMAFRRTLYLIYKEALNNILRHAHAAEVTILLAVSPPHVRLSIQDTGAGFDVEQATEGSGLKNMRRRAREINGTLTITSTPGAGTKLTLTAPLP